MEKLFLAGVDVFRVKLAGFFGDFAPGKAAVTNASALFDGAVAAQPPDRDPRRPAGPQAPRLDLRERRGRPRREGADLPVRPRRRARATRRASSCRTRDHLAVALGDTLLIDDGKVRMTVVEKGDAHIACQVDVPGKISNRKGVNTPSVVLPISALTPKDLADLDVALELGADWIARRSCRSPRTCASCAASCAGAPRSSRSSSLDRP